MAGIIKRRYFFGKILKIILPVVALLTTMVSTAVSAETVSREMGSVQSFSGNVWS